MSRYFAYAVRFCPFLSWMIGGVFCKSLTVISKVLSSQIVVQNIGPCVHPSFITQMVVLQKDFASFGGLNGSEVQSMRQHWAICNKEKVCKKKIYVKARDAKKQKTNVVTLTRNL
jgi:hypothetical protein